MAFPAGFVATQRASLRTAGKDRCTPCQLYDAKEAAVLRSEHLRETEARVVAWIEEVTAERRGDQSTAHWLSTGRVLCRLVNKIVPGLVRESEGASQSCAIENIRRFLQVAQSFGLYEDELFVPLDILDQRDMLKVVMGLRAFAEAVPAAVPRYRGPQLAQGMSFGSLCCGFAGALRVCFGAPPAPSAIPVEHFDAESRVISERTVRGSLEVSMRFDTFAKAKSQTSGFGKSPSVLCGRFDADAPRRPAAEVAGRRSAEKESDCDSADASTHCGSECGDRLADVEL